MTFYFFKKKRYISLGLLITFLMLFSQIALISTNYQPIEKNDGEVPNLSAQFSDTKQWLNNSGFDSPIEPWYNTIDGDASDVQASNSSGVANYEILGEEYTYFEINGTPTTAKGWTQSNNYQYPAEPNQIATMTAYGGRARHYWSETADQQVVVQWDKQILMPRNMSDYVITSASLNITVNATVDANPGSTDPSTYGGLEAYPSEAANLGGGLRQYNIGDFVRYFVCISDQNKIKNYTDVISYKTIGLGVNKPTEYQHDYLNNTVIEVDDENDLINILNNLFHYYNNYNITITIGMFLNCEDNWGSDDDFFEGIYITSINFTFIYKKNINQGTKISWNQDGKRIRELSPENYTVVATDANLRFDYKIDTDWASNTSSINSELRVLLNGFDHKITINLMEINLTSETANFMFNFPLDSVNLSIQVYLRDPIELDKTITISIDNATLDISYVIYFDLPPSDGGGGGGTKYIRGEDYTWLVIILTAGIIALVSSFVAYQKHYKYPPIVRKIRALKKKIRKGKKTSPLLLNTRDELIRKNFKKQTNIVMETELKPESIDKLKKGEG